MGVASPKSALSYPTKGDHATAMAEHARDLARGAGWVELPWALGRQRVFPATRFDIDRATGERRRHHLHESVGPHAIREAVLKAGIVNGRDVSTTMICTHVLNRGLAVVRSPADRMCRI